MCEAPRAVAAAPPAAVAQAPAPQMSTEADDLERRIAEGKQRCQQLYEAGMQDELDQMVCRSKHLLRA